MRTFVVGECLQQNKFDLWDPDASRETEFEMVVARALACVYPLYTCVMFAGSFRYDDRVFLPPTNLKGAILRLPLFCDPRYSTGSKLTRCEALNPSSDLRRVAQSKGS
jgi:hypothetical protein